LTRPKLQTIPRYQTFFAVCVLLAICFFLPYIFHPLSENKNRPVSPPNPPPSLPRSQTSWYVMLGSFNANNGDFAVSSAKSVQNKASEECHVSARTELTAKIEGFTPGYVSTFLGPYETQEDAVADKEKVLPCMPDAYIKSIKP
ncbi:MAG: hypothetical protein ACT4O2_07460, partial [Beijerinckiaceae bacterium]